MRLLAATFATGFGLGYIPKAPGTAGSLGAIALAWALYSFALLSWLQWVILVAAVTLFAIWSAGCLVKQTGLADPQVVVADEVAGQLIAVCALAAYPLWAVLFFGFLSFRALDIIKPFGIKLLERLPGGTGVVMDDVAAGLLAQVLLRTALYYFY